MIHAQNLYFSYTGAPPYVLEGVELSIKPGDYLTMVGGNGSGKSTLMRLLVGFIKPTRGEIHCDAGRVGYVAQKKENAGFPITVREALFSYGKLLKLKDKNAVDAAMQKVNMEAHAGELVGNLSGGQLQKVLIARALMGAPRVLFLDEPSTGVDVSSLNEIYAFLKRLNEEQNITIVSVEHNLDAAIRNSTDIFHLSGGKGHLCTPEQYAREYLGRKG